MIGRRTTTAPGLGCVVRLIHAQHGGVQRGALGGGALVAVVAVVVHGRI